MAPMWGPVFHFDRSAVGFQRGGKPCSTEDEHLEIIMLKIRFAVADSSGHQSATFNVWTGRHDIYVAPRPLGKAFKASIHFARPETPSELRYAGPTRKFTEEFLGQPLPVGQRQIGTWPGRSVGPNLKLELRILVPASELRVPTVLPDNKPVTLIPSPPPGFDREIAILHGAPGPASWWPSPADAKSELVDSGLLPNGEMLWVVHYLSRAIPADKLEEHRRGVIGTHRGWCQPGVEVDPAAHRLLMESAMEDGSALWLDLCADFLAGARFDPITSV